MHSDIVIFRQHSFSIIVHVSMLKVCKVFLIKANTPENLGPLSPAVITPIYFSEWHNEIHPVCAGSLVCDEGKL